MGAPVVLQPRGFDVSLDRMPEKSVGLVLVVFWCPVVVRQVEFESLARPDLRQEEVLLRGVIDFCGTTS